MDPNDELILTRAELLDLHLKYRELKHTINNMFAVIMALSELGQRTPGHLEKLAKSVLERTPEVVKQLTSFGELLGVKLKGDGQSKVMPASGVFPPLPPR